MTVQTEPAAADWAFCATWIVGVGVLAVAITAAFGGVMSYAQAVTMWVAIFVFFGLFPAVGSIASFLKYNPFA